MEQFLPKFRKDKGLTQQELAKKLGISRQAWHALEHGSSHPSLDLLAKMEALFDTPWRDFFPEISQDHPWKKIEEKVASKDFLVNNFNDQDDHYFIEIALPGVKKEEIELEMAKNQLIVRMQRVEEETREEEKHSFYHKVASSSVQRTFVTPEEIDPEKTEAEFKDEVLQVKLFKLNPKTDNKIIKFD
jgi:HSP20 family protein